MQVGCCALGVRFWTPAFYFVGFLLTSAISWVLRDYGSGVLNFSPVNDCLAGVEPDAQGLVPLTCLGNSAVLRISFGSCLFFAAHALLLIGVTTRSNPRLAVHNALWPLQLLVWGGVVGATFAMPNAVFPVWGQISRVLSTFFILLQLFVLLDCVYSVNEWLLERDQCRFVLVGLTALFIVASFVGTGFLFKYYSPSSSCSLNIFFITWNLVLFMAYAAISVSPLRSPNAGLLTSAAVFAYTTYYTWSALNSEPAGGCKTLDTAGNKVIQVIGFVLAILAVGLTTLSSSTSSASMALVAGDAEAGAGRPTAGGEALPHRPDFFHLVFFLASAYMVMLFTGWDLAAAQGNLTVDSGWGSTWVKVAAAWVCALLYAWSLVAHRLLSGRDFT